ncbi:hypothetical protein [Wolbachia endosymbiont (group A) of Anomoia purmunda]|uniref:hypothetical protein n=1 Tax=Wolbachia endosymbiont (group A) of Anomoia purmunda TaxID=2953978 RepID=UPI00222F2DB3|nr:hypothetical protein [Wolbachia endosymbiont (group A) of Anomoia purmunda]
MHWDDRRGDWNDKRRILKQQASRKSYVKSSINENYTIFMHAMVFIINGECDMALTDEFGKGNLTTVQNLIDDGTFIDNLTIKLTTGQNQKMYTKTAADTAFVKTIDLATKVAEKDVVKAIFSAKENVADTQSILVKEVTKEPVVKEILGVKNAAGTKTVLAEEVANKDVVKEILGVKNAAGTKTVLAEEVANKDVAGAILAVQDGKKSILVNKLGEALDRVQDTVDDKVYGAAGHEKIAKDFLADKYPFAKTDGSNIDKDFVGKVFDVTDGAAANPKNIAETKLGTTFAKINASNLTDAKNKTAFAEAILPAKDGDKSILVDKLGDAIASTDTAEYNAGTEQTAKQFLNSRGLIPSEDAIFTKLTSDDKFKTSVTIDVNASNNGFQGAVREVMSQQHFEIPSDPSAPISADW